MTGTFTTIDDLVQLSQELLVRLRQLGGYKHPLAVRRGVEHMAQNHDSRTVRAGATTYFFDVKRTKEGRPYLVITESRRRGETQERERHSLAVFPENAQAFSQAVSDMVSTLE
jgi:hypothetical protein